MISSFTFELLKLRKRPSTWVLGLFLVLIVLFFDYYQFYSAITSLEAGGSDPTQQVTDVGEFKEYLLPASVTVNVSGPARHLRRSNSPDPGSPLCRR